MFRCTDYRSFELLGECYQNLGFLEHALDQLICAIKCPKSPVALLKKASILYHSVGDGQNYLIFYTKYFEACIANNQSQLVSIHGRIFLLTGLGLR